MYWVEYHQRRTASGAAGQRVQTGVAHGQRRGVGHLLHDNDVFRVGAQRFQPRRKHDVGVVLLGKIIHQAGHTVLSGAACADVGGPFQRQPGLAHARHTGQNGDGIQRQIRLDQVLGLPRFHVRHGREAKLLHGLAAQRHPRDLQAIAGVGVKLRCIIVSSVGVLLLADAQLQGPRAQQHHAAQALLIGGNIAGIEKRKRSQQARFVHAVDLRIKHLGFKCQFIGLHGVLLTQMLLNTLLIVVL